jgi:hypothetical protein
MNVLRELRRSVLLSTRTCTTTVGSSRCHRTGAMPAKARSAQASKRLCATDPSARCSVRQLGRLHRGLLSAGFTVVETVCAAAGLALLATSAGSLLTLAARNHAVTAARIRTLGESELVMETFRNAVNNAHRVVVDSSTGSASDQRQLVLERSPSVTLAKPTRITFKVTNNQLLRTGGNTGIQTTTVNSSIESLVFRYGVPDADGNLEYREIGTIPASQLSGIVAVEVDLTLRADTVLVREVAQFRLRPISPTAHGVPRTGCFESRNRERIT